MFDPVKRQKYSDLFDFEKFHKSFQLLLATADGSHAFTMEQYICDHPEFWKDYDIAYAQNLASILEDEVFETYSIQTDFEGNLILVPQPKQIQSIADR